MKKAKAQDGSESIDRISDLPKEILQRILYFLSLKEAVRTSVLSKSWRYNWCTRPNLDFFDVDFKRNKQYFRSTVDKTLQLYIDQGLSLEIFTLDISLHHEWVSLLEKWIPLLTTTMGVKEFNLLINPEPSVPGIIDLPSIIFKAESLKLLRLYRCNLGQNTPDNIPFVRLQALYLSGVLIKKEIFDKIISSCPLLTTIYFFNCKGLKTVKLEKKLYKHLKHFTFTNCGKDECNIEIEVPTLETIKISSCKIRFQVHKFSNLKTLSLSHVEIISGNYSIQQSHQLICNIDAPNISDFEYRGVIIPSISFKLTSGRSHLQLSIEEDVDDAQSWFLRLCKLLQALNQSEITLDIAHFFMNNMNIEQDILVHDITDGGNRPVVVDHLQLNIDEFSSFPSFLNGLFCICRPRIITLLSLYEEPLEEERRLKELGDFFCKIQTTRESGNQEIWQGLEDLTIESFDKSLQEWQPLRVTTLSECALLPDINSFRVRLQWSVQDSDSSFKLSKS